MKHVSDIINFGKRFVGLIIHALKFQVIARHQFTFNARGHIEPIILRSVVRIQTFKYET